MKTEKDSNVNTIATNKASHGDIVNSDGERHDERDRKNSKDRKKNDDNKGNGYDNKNAESEYSVAYQNVFKLRSTDIFLGNANADLTLIEYSSLGCYHCANFHQNVFPKIKEKLIDSGKLKYVVRHYPTSMSSYTGALFAYCSKDYYAALDILFKTYERWAFSQNYTANLSEIMKISGQMSESEVRACIKNKSLMDSVSKKVYEDAQILKITATPVFFLNGKRFDSSDELVRYINKTLENISEGEIQLQIEKSSK